jgi:hypothetical protein
LCCKKTGRRGKHREREREEINERVWESSHKTWDCEEGAELTSFSIIPITLTLFSASSSTSFHYTPHPRKKEKRRRKALHCWQSLSNKAVISRWWPLLQQLGVRSRRCQEETNKLSSHRRKMYVKKWTVNE